MKMSEICFKRLSVVFVTAFLILNLAEIIYGGYQLYEDLITFRMDVLLKSMIFLPASFLIVLALINLLLICFGCIGLLQEVICCIECYATTLFIFSILQVGGGIWFMSQYNVLNKDLSGQIENNVKHAFEDNKTLMFNIQEVVHCCGVNSPADYVMFELPPSCCAKTESSTGPCTKNSNIYKNGCAFEQFEYVISKNSVLSMMYVANGILQIIAALSSVVFSCCYLRKY